MTKAPKLAGNYLTDASALSASFKARWTLSDDRYATSPFLALKQMSSRRKGAEFEQIASHVLTQNGHKVERATSSEFDRLVDGKRVEIKGSFLWTTGGFRWQQIRANQDYDILAVLAFYPDRMEMFGCTKATAHQHLTQLDDEGNLRHNQHGGKTVDSGTYFIDGSPEAFEWLRPLSEVLAQHTTSGTDVK